MTPEITIRRNTEERRFEAFLGEARVGVITYRLVPGRISLLHTEVDASARGSGVAVRLVVEALADARAAGWEVLPFCPFVRRYIARHPEYLDLVPGDRRGAFGLG